MEGDAEEFLDTNPDASVQDLMERFGDPSLLAHSYIDSLDADELNKQIQKSKIVKRIVLFTCLVILLAVVVVAILFIINISTGNPARVITIVEDDQVIITGVSEIPVEEALTSDLEPNTSIVIDQQSETTEVIEEIFGDCH
ncbi:MAG: hypothetical protein IKM39_02745 [Clostridia bacterium]|nr:hypothetical protein [Clostridia bacterium]